MDQEKKYKCGKCQIENVRLYREYGSFFYHEDIRCNKCINEKSRSWYVPIRVSPDGAIWGHCAGDPESREYFYSLPESDPAYPIWQPDLMLTDDQNRKVLIHADWSNGKLRRERYDFCIENGFK